MKFWIRFSVSLAVVLVIGFSVWFFAFREKSEVQAYNRTSELVDYKESLAIKDDLVELNSMNYYGGESANVIDSSTQVGKEIYRLRALTVGGDKIVAEGTSGTGYTYESYRITDLMVDDILEYLLPYTKASSVKSKSLSKLKKSINSYIDSLKELNSTVDELMAFQNSMEGNDASFDALRGRYRSFSSKYRSSLNNASNLIMSLMDFIDISVYGDNIVLDEHMALFDAFARALAQSTSVDVNQENDYFNDVYVVMQRIEEVNDGDDIYSERYSEYDFLSSYNELFNNHKDALQYIFSCKNLQKKQMAGGKELSNISKTAQNYVIAVLNVLGYVGA